MTEYGDAPDLVTRIRNLILDPATLEWREKEVRQFPYLLTIEDYVSRCGPDQDWGFDDRTVREALARVEYFDEIAGRPHYVSQADPPRPRRMESA
jgi:hypothetical protein